MKGPPLLFVHGAADDGRVWRPQLEEIAGRVRPESLRKQLFVMAETDQRELLPRIVVPTLLIWGELDARSPLSVAHHFEHALPDARLVVIPGSGHMSRVAYLPCRAEHAATCQPWKLTRTGVES